jgi:predicted transcriptional regulator
MKAPKLRRSELEMGVDILKVLSVGSAEGKTTRQLLGETNVNHKVFKKMEPQMLRSGLITRNRKGKSILFKTSDFGKRVLKDYGALRGYFMKKQTK